MKEKRRKGEKEKRRRGEKEKRRKGEEEKRRRGEKEKRREGEKEQGEKEQGEKEKRRIWCHSPLIGYPQRSSTLRKSLFFHSQYIPFFHA